MDSVKEQFYEIIIGGIKLEEYYLSNIEEIIHEDNATGSSLLHLTIKDPHKYYIENEFLIEDTPINFKGGWRGDTIEFKGWISVIDMDFPEDGIPSLTLRCMDNGHRLNREKKKRTWEKVRVSAVAKQIFEQNGLRAVIDTTPIIEESVSQSEQTDIEFVLSLVSKVIEDYICYIEGDTGYFVKKNVVQSPQKTLEYRKGNGDLKSFSPRLAKETKQDRKDNSDIDTGTGTNLNDSSNSGGNLLGLDLRNYRWEKGRWEVFVEGRGIVRQPNRRVGEWKPL